MAISNKALNDKLREEYLALLSEFFTTKGEEVLRTNSNEIALPCTDSEQNEKFIVLTVKVPTGSRDGELYDGYLVADDYKMKLEQKTETSKKKAEEKAKKMERDAKMREKNIELKAKRENH